MTNELLARIGLLEQENQQLKERITKAQDFIRNESSLNDAEIDELAMILEGDI